MTVLVVVCLVGSKEEKMAVIRGSRTWENEAVGAEREGEMCCSDEGCWWRKWVEEIDKKRVVWALRWRQANVAVM